MSSLRKGVQGPFPGDKTYSAHLGKSTKCPFHMAAQCPHPKGVVSAAKLRTRTPYEDLEAFRTHQLKALGGSRPSVLQFRRQVREARRGHAAITLKLECSTFRPIIPLLWPSGGIVARSIHFLLSDHMGNRAIKVISNFR